MLNNSHKYVILVVDDDNRIRKLLGKFLREHNFIVLLAQDAAEARFLIKSYLFDLLILDVMMPKETGIELSAFLRQESDIPILMLSAMGEVDNRIEGLESGADDYISKPFEPKELLLRIKKIIERASFAKAIMAKKIIKIGNMLFDFSNNSLKHNNEMIHLTSGEAKLLGILAENMGTTMSRQNLGILCGGINERSIDVQIIRLRHKIELDAKKPQYLHTVRGEGYVLYE
jgi:two-component system phosphate regulon response regulator OmpR